jgi:hypothetical protein
MGLVFELKNGIDYIITHKNNTPPHLFKGVILVEKLSTI